MAIYVGDKLPGANLLQMGPNGAEVVDLGARFTGRKVVLFGLPGAYTGTCTSAHVPSYIRTIDQLKSKGVDEVICVSVNDPFVMESWAVDTGAKDAGITMLADPAAEFTKAIGMNFTAPPVGFYDRSIRFSLCAEDGVVTVFNKEEQRGVCEITAGETMLESL